MRPPPVSAERLRRETFTAPAERVARVTAVVLRRVEPEAAVRVLDVGCGTGEQLLALAAALSRAGLTGLDISEPSIRRARAAAAARGVAGRISFHAGDYMAFQDGPFDLILADTVLHAIPAPTGDLFAKLSADLAPGALLIYTMPSSCGYNRALAGFRRVLRWLQHPVTDRLILVVARFLHGRAWDSESLRERIPYMYLVPARYDGPGLHALLSDTFALDLVERVPLPHASPAQMKHTLAVFRKRPA